MPTQLQSHLTPAFLPVPRQGTRVTHYAHGRRGVTAVEFLPNFEITVGDDAQLRVGRACFQFTRPGFRFIVESIVAELRFTHLDEAGQGDTMAYAVGTVAASGAGTNLTGTAANVLGSATTTDLDGTLLERAAAVTPVLTDRLFLNVAANWSDVTDPTLRVGGKLTVSWLAIGPQ